ncbi:Peroxisomal membrane protein PEX16 [Erysiphe neolycopersici]|uniref:Peroxisomal membrane protein PEX16 n=1 Tax=Erysiphe neolycopersici TaxID=212602 RepID=A0A420HXV2_9PEZI|nr:Peroxisomal membrane protein PEX16 [Erysiphe neolycopersici]
MKSPITSSSRKISAALKFPPKCLQMYDHFITSNQSAVTSIESTLRSLTYVIPGRFRDAELASESLHCSIQLLSLYHDKLLLRSDASLSNIASLQSPHNRYTKFWYQRSRYYRRIALILNVIQYTKLLWEMVAKRRGEKARWRIVVILEIMEAVCKLNLLQITKSRPPVNPPFPIREVLNHSDSSIAEEDGMTGDSLNTQLHTTPKEYQLKRTGMKLPTLPNPKDISSYLLSRVLSADDIKAPSTLLNQLHGSVYVAEVLYILQPVIYAIIISLKRDKSSWQPWAIGISIDYLIRYLRKKDNLRATALEKEQWGKRNWALAWWIMRGAFYEKFTKGLLHRTSESLPSFFAGILDDYLYLWDGYYSSTSF